MRKIKNDPAEYTKRSDLYPKSRIGGDNRRGQRCKKREREYLTAPIDACGYIDFKSPPQSGSVGE